jgi:guanylate kinase
MNAKLDAQGTTFIVSAPSGAGKTTLVRELLSRTAVLELSVSLTTRAARAGEEDGVHYHFVTRAAFEDSIARGEMLEHADVFGNLYGTSKHFVEERLNAGVDVVLEIDWQGAKLARERLAQTVSIMILPPSLDELANRLRSRGKDSADVIARRLSEARTELSHMDEFDYWVINDKFDEALRGLRSIVESQRLHRSQQKARHADLVAGLLP